MNRLLFPYILTITFFLFNCSGDPIKIADPNSIPKLMINPDWSSKSSEIVKILQDYLKIPTVRGKENEASIFLQNILKNEGISSTLIPCPGNPERSNLIAELIPESPITKKGIILINHTDVVEANSSEWTQPPFSGALVNDRIYGRGAIDMKGMGIMELMAFIELKRNKFPIQRKIMFLALADEETGGECGSELLTKNYQALFKDYEFAINEGGVGTKNVVINGSKIFNIQYAEKGVIWLDVKSKGISGHGSTPNKEYASLNLIRFLEEIQSLEKSPTFTPETEKFFYQLGTISDFPNSFLLKRTGNFIVKKLMTNTIQNNRHLSAMTYNTSSITGLKTESMSQKGYNVIDNEALAKIDFRILPGTNSKDYLTLIENVAKKYNIEIIPSVINDPTSSPISGEMFQVLARIAINNVPDAIITPFLSPGATDSKFFRDIGIKCYGLIPALLESEDIDTMHGKNENISIENLILGTKILFETLSALN
jgi:acetylornithine deacetylase/succinyl-diaminopimelate desuccinylase-like protein